MVRQAADAYGIEFVSRIDSLDGVFSTENEINFYRILQEFVNNILKHSKATRAEIAIQRTAGKVEVLIADDGNGLSSGTLDRQKRSGFGLFGIEERLRILGGKFSIDSEPGQGTKISVTIEEAK
jgi:signal transduction histidine kinase